VILILGWATVLAFVFICLISGPPDYIARIDKETLEKHRKPVEQVDQPQLRRIK
jgi:hypothetical protein